MHDIIATIDCVIDRKRKMFSKKYHDELDEARKAIEEAKWKRGIPDETKFDQHVEEAVSKRPRVAREPEEPVSPGELFL